MELDKLLGNLHSDRSRLEFLKKVYKPGYTEAADRILAIGEGNLSVIVTEMKHAENVEDRDRFRSMARKKIDYYVKHELHLQLKDFVTEQKDYELANYALAQMDSHKPKDIDHKIYQLRYFADIARAFDMKDVARAKLEELLFLKKRQTRRDFSIAEILGEIGRYEEAINVYMSCGYVWMSKAMDLAKEHCPSRILEIAKKGFGSFKAKKGGISFYVECAEILGKTNEAEKTLVRHTKRVKIDSEPGFYESLVKALVLLNQEGGARELVERVAQYEKEKKIKDRHYGSNRLEKLARLYHAVGETEAVKGIYAEIIETRIREKHNPSNVMKEIERACELIGDKRSFIEERMVLHEMQGEYEKAAELATESGNPELAKKYDIMHELVQSSQP